MSARVPVRDRERSMITHRDGDCDDGRPLAMWRPYKKGHPTKRCGHPKNRQGQYPRMDRGDLPWGTLRRCHVKNQ